MELNDCFGASMFWVDFQKVIKTVFRVQGPIVNVKNGKKQKEQKCTTTNLCDASPVAPAFEWSQPVW